MRYLLPRESLMHISTNEHFVVKLYDDISASFIVFVLGKNK